MAKPPLRSHIKEEEKKRLFTLCNHTGVWCACGCVNVCVCAHLSACVYELFVSPPQALSCWVCSLKRLCFCCHPSLLLPVFSCSHSASSVLSACLYHSPSPSCLSVFHYRCVIIIVFKGQCEKGWRSVSFIAFHIQRRR